MTKYGLNDIGADDSGRRELPADQGNSGVLERYTRVAMALHWIMALGILALLTLGLVMVHVSLDSGTVFSLHQLHKSIGITVLLVAFLRVAWRLTHRPPSLPRTMTPVEMYAAHAEHALLYAALFLMPLSGWAFVSSSALGIPTVLFGVVPWPNLPVLPDLIDKGPVEAAFKLIHTYGAYGLIALLVVHIGAVLRHHFWLRDTIVTRMLPARRHGRSR